MAATFSRSEMLVLAMSGQENHVPAAEERAQDQPHRFLALAPATSASYPANPAPAAAPGAGAAAPAIAPADKARRSSSLSSDGSLVQKRRFLRLGPVHSGQGDGDWSEEVVE